MKSAEPGRLAFGLLLFTLVFSPLAFGTVEHWSKTVVQLVVPVALIFCLLDLLRTDKPYLRVPGLLPLLLLLGLLLGQLLPLPIWVVKIVSPQSWEAYRLVSEQGAGDGWLTISVHRKATLQEFLRLGTGVLLYVLTVQVLTSGARIRRVFGFVVLVASCIAFFAILQQFSSDGKIFWFRAAPGGSPGGPWININQYAAYIEAICPLALALFLFYRPPVNADMSWRERFVSFFSSPRTNLHLFLGFAFVLLAFSVFITLCRGGIITILLSMMLFTGLRAVVKHKGAGLNLWVVLCLVLLAMTLFGWQPVVDEFDKSFDDSWELRDGRSTLYADTLSIIKDYPLVGSGFGTFVDVYPAYKTIAGNLVFEHAHNDYLELLANGGVVGFSLASWFCLAVLLHGWRRIRKRHDRYAVLMGIGILTSIGALLIHSMVDFNLQNGAIGFYFFFLFGLLVATVNRRYRYHEDLSLLAEGGRGNLLALCFLSVLFLGLVGIVQIGIMMAAKSFNGVKDTYISSHLDPVIMDRIIGGIAEAQKGDPLESFYPFYQGNLAVLREGREAALAHFQKAALLRPMEGIYLQRIGLMMSEDRKQEAARLMAEGYRRALLKNRLVASWVEWLLISEQRQEAIDLIKEWFVRDTNHAATLIPLIETHRFTHEEVAEVLPPSVEAWIRFGHYKEKIGEIEEAGYYRSRALTFIDREEEVRPGWFAQLISYHQRHNQPGEALSVLRQAVERCPDHAPFHIMLGDHYIKENITYRALEEYQKAVALEPGNESYRRRLRKLELDIEFGK